MPRKSDIVNHPDHYTFGDIECIDAIKASMPIEAYAGYLKGNAMKYLWRYENKGKAEEDLAKARWYINRLLDDVVVPIPNMWGGETNVNNS